ncbi:hypothetical protein KSC_104900 [Ktedonobacter sp. SOSP1-52]|uniref:DUF4118 domain-containing protein n=1 Tax=Ktedonobacter sp. SOSP1-52 TaxID=2778366 RepID=UPI0019154E17|nr:DUF4118 domain-containing protein [Ktedonobacter sp. SOSP1-52]GHO71598.1 hypothetical protein KSC_104900 [Ktedonobacter sp. SOSP1-52]
MKAIERIPQLELPPRMRWQKIVLDTVFAIGGVLIITGIMALLQLYPAIPNISMLYLLLILPLATFRGFYPAILAAILAFLAFNFFLVPPLYTFVMPVSEWLALGIFLLTALVTSQLATISRQRAQQAWQRERETRVLYEMMHAVNSKITFDEQLDVIALSTVRIFSPWGVRECALLLPNNEKQLVVRADAPIQIEAFTFSPEQQHIAVQVMAEGKKRTVPSALVSSGEPALLHLLPLQAGEQRLGVLALRVKQEQGRFARLEHMLDERERSDNQSSFFWTFLDQVISTLERERLRAATAGL